MFARIALLNIVKHAKRSLVVFFAVMVAVTVLTLIGGFIRGLGATFLDSILPTAGHIVVKAEGTKKAPNPMDLKYLVPDGKATLENLSDRRITVKEEILTFPALVVQSVPTDTKKEAKNIGLLGQGVQPGTRFIQNIRQGIVQGEFLPGGAGICLSRRACKLLDVHLGDGVMVLTQDRGNNPWYQELKITGVFDSGSDQVDENFFAVSHKTAETLLDAEGMTREIRILVQNPDEAPAIAEDLNKTLKDRGLRAEPWQETFGSFLTIMKFIDIISLVIRVFFVIIAASVITNSILMTVFERTREYGTLRAIGLKKGQLFQMIVTEGILLGLFGSLAGLILGIGAVGLLSQVGVDIGSLTEYLGFNRRFYPVQNPGDWIFTFASGVLVAVLASLYAARVSSKMTVTQALTHI